MSGEQLGGMKGVHCKSMLLSGVLGYACKQAAICTHMAERCAMYWLAHLEKKGFTPVWESDYVHLLHEGSETVEVEAGSDDIEYDGDEDEGEMVAEDEVNEGDCFNLYDLVDY